MGKYVSSTLNPGETVEYETHLHWIIFFGGWVLTATIIGAIIGVPLLISRAITKSTSEFAVTSNRVVVKVGWLSRRTIEMSLSRVESIDVIQGIIGRIFGYGTIVIIGTGASREPFHTIDQPLEFRRAVQRMQAMYK